MKILSITGGAAAGKTHALIAIANAALASGSASVAFVSPWPDEAARRMILSHCGLDPAVRHYTARSAISAMSEGFRPSTVFVDEFDKFNLADRARLVAELRRVDVEHVVIAGCADPEAATLAA